MALISACTQNYKITWNMVLSDFPLYAYKGEQNKGAHFQPLVEYNTHDKLIFQFG